MNANIHRDALSAWNALRDSGGLEVDDRDAELLQAIQDDIDPNAGDIETALAGQPPERLLRALFKSLGPFVAMFRDILAFFEQAGARQGQSQWRISVGDAFLDLAHFEEFLARWDRIEAEIDVPALDFRGAWALNNARNETAYDYLTQGMRSEGPPAMGMADVDAWLSAYDAGRYDPLPEYLMPRHFTPGLADAASMVLAGLRILREMGLDRKQLIEEQAARRFKSVDNDAFHPWTIAQNETDSWLRSSVIYLANLRRGSAAERQEMDARLVERFAAYPRRRIPVRLDIQDLERLLSLPVWKQRHETYGVWVATRIVDAVADHDVVINAPDGALPFAFREARIADIDSARPELSLYSERRVSLADPVGKSRKESAQPDFSLWTRDDPAACVLVVEVKHYKKRARRNFHDALDDYARAHPEAKVVLVNYGPVGAEFDDLTARFNGRCQLLGHLLPGNDEALTAFRAIVRARVGDRVFPRVAGTGRIVAIDVSGSMRAAIQGAAFREWLAVLPEAQIALIDEAVRGTVAPDALPQWLNRNGFGGSTSLAAPVAELLAEFPEVTVATDMEGFASLAALNCTRIAMRGGGDEDFVLAEVVR